VGLGIDLKVARLEADRLVAEHWVAIVRVAVKLHDESVFEPDVVEALGGSDDEIRAAAERGRRRDELAQAAADAWHDSHDSLVRLLRLRREQVAARDYLIRLLRIRATAPVLSAVV
jgi:hypothetical protein